MHLARHLEVEEHPVAAGSRRGQPELDRPLDELRLRSAELATRLGLSDYFDWKDPSDVLRWRVNAAEQDFAWSRLHAVEGGS